MATLLQIKSSIFGDNGNSSQLVNALTETWKAKHPAGEVITHDFANEAIPHLDGARVQAIFTDAAERSPEQAAIVAYADQLIDEVKRADTIVIGVPMYNFGIPSSLKAWIDHIARAGSTFKYTDQGPVGLVDDKPVYIIAARGGEHCGTDRDVQTQFLTTFFGFIGIRNVNFVYAEGLNMGNKDQAFAEAKAKIDAAVA